MDQKLGTYARSLHRSSNSGMLQYSCNTLTDTEAKANDEIINLPVDCCESETLNTTDTRANDKVRLAMETNCKCILSGSHAEGTQPQVGQASEATGNDSRHGLEFQGVGDVSVFVCMTFHSFGCHVGVCDTLQACHVPNLIHCVHIARTGSRDLAACLFANGAEDGMPSLSDATTALPGAVSRMGPGTGSAGIAALTPGDAAICCIDTTPSHVGIAPGISTVPHVGPENAQTHRFRADMAEISKPNILVETGTQCSRVKPALVDEAIQVVTGTHEIESQTSEISERMIRKGIEMMDKATSISIGDTSGTGSVVPEEIGTVLCPKEKRAELCSAAPLMLTYDAPKLLTYERPKLLTYSKPLLLTYPANDRDVNSQSSCHNGTCQFQTSESSETDATSASFKFRCSSFSELSLMPGASAKEPLSFEDQAISIANMIVCAQQKCYQHFDTMASLQSRTSPASNGVGMT